MFTNIKQVLDKINKNEEISAEEFKLVCDYVKSSNYKPNLSLSMILIKNHALGINKLDDFDTIKIIINDIAKSFLSKKVEVIFSNEELNEKENIIYLDEKLITNFIDGNYIEIFNKLFFKLNMFEKEITLKENKKDFKTFKIVANMINSGVDLSRIFIDKKYKPYNFLNDERANSFIEVLKFFEILGVNLVELYINTNILNVKPEKRKLVKNTRIISTDIKFLSKLKKMDKEKVDTLISTYPSLSLFYTGKNRISTIDLIKNMENKSIKKEILRHLESRIIEPHIMIDDAIELDTTYDDKETQKIVNKLLKYIYPDTFYYSLNFYLELNSNKKDFDYINYLDELLIKVNSYTPDISENFVNEVLYIIEEVKQNI